MFPTGDVPAVGWAAATCKMGVEGGVGPVRVRAVDMVGRVSCRRDAVRLSRMTSRRLKEVCLLRGFGEKGLNPGDLNLPMGGERNFQGACQERAS